MSYTKAFYARQDLIEAEQDLRFAEQQARYSPVHYARWMRKAAAAQERVRDARIALRKAEADIKESHRWLKSDEAQAIKFKNRGNYQDENGVPF
jgi:hypothetical protein